MHKQIGNTSYIQETEQWEQDAATDREHQQNRVKKVQEQIGNTIVKYKETEQGELDNSKEVTRKRENKGNEASNR